MVLIWIALEWKPGISLAGIGAALLGIGSLLSGLAAYKLAQKAPDRHDSEPEAGDAD